MSRRQDILRELLESGNTVPWSERGNSMRPIIKDRQKVTIAPVDATQLEVGDIVFVRVSGKYWLHKISALQGERVQIANNKGHVNGWTNRKKVYGIVIAVEEKEIRGAREKVRDT